MIYYYVGTYICYGREQSLMNRQGVQGTSYDNNEMMNKR